jgi:hypothetical protein
MANIRNQRGATDPSPLSPGELSGRSGQVGPYRLVHTRRRVCSVQTWAHGSSVQMRSVSVMVGSGLGGLTGKHDDRVMALSLANLGAQQSLSSAIVFL